MEFEIIKVDDGFAYDVRLLDENATVGDYIRLLDEFLDEKVAPCLGCDLCCSQRIPVIAAVMPSVAPMETSISPVMMTNAMPTASRVYIVAVLKQLMMLE